MMSEHYYSFTYILQSLIKLFINRIDKNGIQFSMVTDK